MRALQLWRCLLIAPLISCPLTQGSSVSQIALEGEVILPGVTLTSIDANTYENKLKKQLVDFLYNATGLESASLDQINATFGNNPVKANYTWIKTLNSSAGIDVEGLRRSGVHTFHIFHTETDFGPAIAGPTEMINPTVAIAVISILGSMLLLILGALTGYAIRAKWKRSSLGVFPAMDFVRRDDTCSYMETGTYRKRKFPEDTTNNEVVEDQSQTADESSIIHAWVRAQLRDSQAAQNRQQHQQQFQGPKKPKRFSFRLIGKAVDHFDSGVASTVKTCRSCDYEETLARSSTIRSANDVNAAGYVTYGASLQAALENPRAPIYKKNRMGKVAASCSVGERAATPESERSERVQPPADVDEVAEGGHPPEAEDCCSLSPDSMERCSAIGRSRGTVAAEVPVQIHCSAASPDRSPGGVPFGPASESASERLATKHGTDNETGVATTA